MEADEASNYTVSEPGTGIAVCAEGSVRRRIRHALADAEEPVEIAGDVEELLDSTLSPAEPPACVILAAPRIDAGFGEVVAKVHSRVPSAPILTVSGRAGAGDVRRAIDYGVDGVVLEGRIDSALAPVVEAVRNGQTSVPSAHRTEIDAEVLTQRERQVLALVARGMSNAELASELFLTESTVKSHLSSAFAKLNVSSRHEAARLILDPVRGPALGIQLDPDPRNGSVAPEADPHALPAA
jgi:DNA-binding NarL/FixJ family response regulator